MQAYESGNAAYFATPPVVRPFIAQNDEREIDISVAELDLRSRGLPQVDH